MEQFPDQKEADGIHPTKTVMGSLWIDNADGTRIHMRVQRSMTMDEDRQGRISLEEQNARFDQKYQEYLIKFHRWDKRLAWFKFAMRHPIAAICAALSGNSPPTNYRRPTPSEVDYVVRRL